MHEGLFGVPASNCVPYVVLHHVLYGSDPRNAETTTPLQAEFKELLTKVDECDLSDIALHASRCRKLIN